MKYLGIDYGAKRIGIAVSDDEGNFSFPFGIVENSPEAFARLEKLTREKNIEKLVVGMPGPGGDLAQTLVRTWAEKLSDKLKLPVFFQDETLTSHFASGPLSPRKNTSDSRDRIRGNDGRYPDANAAALILQRYLDRGKPEDKR